MTDTPEYEVGYRRPPRKSRFKKGQSGNPRGRPKGSKNLASIIHATVRERITITENGRRRRISKLEAAAKQTANKAAAGDTKAFRLLSEMLQQLDGGPPLGQSNLPEADQKVMKRLVARLRASGKPKKGETDAQS